MSTPEFDAEQKQTEYFYETPRSEIQSAETAPETAPVDGERTASEEHQSFEELTLGEVIGQFLRAPRATYRALVDVAGTPLNFPAPQVSVPAAAPKAASQAQISRVPALPGVTLIGDKRQRMRLGLYFSAFAMAFWGCLILVSAETRYEASQLHAGAPFLLAGFLIWLGAEIYADWPAIQAWRQRKAETPPTEAAITAPADDPPDTDAETAESAGETASLSDQITVFWQGIHPVRVFAALGLLIFGLITWFDSVGNRFRFLGFWSWVIAIVLVIAVIAPPSWSLSNAWEGLKSRLERIRLRDNWTLIALVLIFLLGALFRLSDLVGVPPEMTSDHIEKLLDSQRVVEGDRDIFFTNNGGREPFQMYAMAVISQLPGLGMNFTTLKLLAIFEGLTTIPVLFWMGREVIGERDRKLGNAVGLILAAFVAVSYWHVAISRLALRIPLTPLIAALLVIFLSRAIRYNRRGDFILAGMVLGFGLYTYQAVRMLPLVVLAGMVFAMFYHIHDRRQVLRYIQNLAVLVAVAFVMFIPLFRFSVDYPEAFWMRTAGRLLGDELIQETDTAGNIIERNARIDERLSAFGQNLPVLTNNIRNALLMYNWKGDVAWINGVPNYPAMDSFTGAFLIVGLAAWLALVVRRRDPVYLMIPVMVFIMLLPSALSIAAPMENPSATRSSGSIPPAYLLAAFPLAMIALQVRRVVVGKTGAVLAVGVVFLAVMGAYTVNAKVYFENYRASYEHSWRSHSLPGRILRGFVLSDGGYGNAFLIHYQHWLDHRIVGLEAGILDWMNAIVSREELPDFLNDAFRCVEYNYRFEPDRDILFFFHRTDFETEEALHNWFPTGRMMVIETPDIKDEFKIYRVPALGLDGFRAWLDENRVNPRCWYGTD